MSSRRWLLAVLACTLFAACGSKQNPVPTPSACDATANVSYDNQIKSVLEHSCTSCHSASATNRNGAPTSVNLETYADAVAHADRANSQAKQAEAESETAPARRMTVKGQRAQADAAHPGGLASEHGPEKVVERGHCQAGSQVGRRGFPGPLKPATHQVECQRRQRHARSDEGRVQKGRLKAGRGTGHGRVVAARLLLERSGRTQVERRLHPRPDGRGLFRRASLAPHRGAPPSAGFAARRVAGERNDLRPVVKQQGCLPRGYAVFVPLLFGRRGSKRFQRRGRGGGPHGKDGRNAAAAVVATMTALRNQGTAMPTAHVSGPMRGLPSGARPPC